MEKLKEYNDYIRATKSYLRKLNQFKATAENRRELVAMWEKELAHTESDIAAPIAQYGEKAGHGTPELNTVEMSAAKREMLEKRIKQGKRELNRLEHIINCVERSLEMLDAQGRELIEAYYFEGDSWANIAKRCYLSEKWAAEKGRRAVREIAGMLFGSELVREQGELFVFAI